MQGFVEHVPSSVQEPRNLSQRPENLADKTIRDCHIIALNVQAKSVESLDRPAYPTTLLGLGTSKLEEAL